MVLPLNNLAFSQINSELGRNNSATYEFDDAEGRKLASAGNTGQSLVPGSEIRLSRFREHARCKLTIASNTQNYDVYTQVSSVNYSAGKTYASIVNNAIIGSSNTESPGMNISNQFLSGDLLELINTNYIVGKGGTGGGSSGNSNGFPGGKGGNALVTSFSISVTNNGTIGGGGGGGGGGAGFLDGANNPIAGGFGGPGAGYEIIPPATLTVGGNGTGGIGIPAGGWGGNLGENGNVGSPSATRSGGQGGNPGNAIVGNNFITWIVTGERLGPIIN